MLSLNISSPIMKLYVTYGHTNSCIHNLLAYLLHLVIVLENTLFCSNYSKIKAVKYELFNEIFKDIICLVINIVAIVFNFCNVSKAQLY